MGKIQYRSVADERMVCEGGRDSCPCSYHSFRLCSAPGTGDFQVEDTVHLRFRDHFRDKNAVIDIPVELFMGLVCVNKKGFVTVWLRCHWG